MTVLIHVAGDSDLGIARNETCSHDLYAIRQGRLNELSGIDDSKELGRRLLDMQYDVKAEEESRGRNVTPKGFTSTPLANSLKSLNDLKETGQLHILVIGTTGDDGATEQIALALVQHLKRLAPTIEERYGLTVRDVDSVILPSLFEKDWVLLEEVMNKVEPKGNIILPVAGGATSIVAGVAGAAIASGRDLKMLLAKSETAQFHSLTIGADPIRGWLLSLGLPTLLERDYRADEQVQQAADSVKRAFDGASLEQRADSLGQLLLMDVARGDLAAGMSIRAWLLSEFRSRLAGERSDQDDRNSWRREYKKPLNKGILSKVIRVIEKDSDPNESERWLLDRKDLLDAGEKATHEFASLLNSDDAQKTRDEVRRGVGEEKVPEFLSWPNEYACLICSVGTNAQQSARGEFASNLMKQEPPEEIRLACSVDRPLRLHTVLLASQDSVGRAHDVKGGIEASPADSKRASSWACGTAEVIDYGISATHRKTAEELKELIAFVSDTVKKSLEDCSPRPRAIVVAALGEKETLLAALSATQDYGAQWGIPVFLASTVRGEEERRTEELQFHRFGLGADARKALLTAALYCMERLDLLSAHRLLTLGDRKMRERAEGAKILAEHLATAVKASQIDDYATLVIDVFRVVADLCQPSHEETSRARLATIAGELIKGKDRGGKGQEDKEESRLLKRLEKGDFELPNIESAELCHRLTMIYQVRNETPLNHGEGTVDQALEKVLEKRINSASLPVGMTYSDLLETTAGEIEDAISADQLEPSTWKANFDELYKWIQDALKA